MRFAKSIFFLISLSWTGTDIPLLTYGLGINSPRWVFGVDSIRTEDIEYFTL